MNFLSAFCDLVMFSVLRGTALLIAPSQPYQKANNENVMNMTSVTANSS